MTNVCEHCGGTIHGSESHRCAPRQSADAKPMSKERMKRIKFLRQGIVNYEIAEALDELIAEVERQAKHIEALEARISRMSTPTTLVACTSCGVGVRRRNTVKGMCMDCAKKEIERLRGETQGFPAILNSAINQESQNDKKRIAELEGAIENGIKELSKIGMGTLSLQLFSEALRGEAE